MCEEGLDLLRRALLIDLMISSMTMMKEEEDEKSAAAAADLSSFSSFSKTTSLL